MNIDLLIVLSFLFITLLLGLWAGRGIKDIREYAIANKQFGTGVLTMTILATYITGSKGIGYVGYVFDDGILPIFSVILCGAIITFLFIAWCIVPNMQRFVGCLTLPEVMGQLYGQSARFWMGILGTGYSVALVALQMIWLGYVGALFNLSSQLSIFLGGIFLVIYAARGGMKAVAITDVLQFIAMLVFVPLVAYVVLYHVGGIKSLFRQVPPVALDVLHHPSLKDYIIYCIWDLFPAFPLSFPFIQRMLMARDKPQLVNSYYIGLSFLTIFYLLLTLIGLAAMVLRTTSDLNMPQQGSNIFVYLVKNYLPIGAQGVIGAGFIAGIMSTADSFLHTAGLALAHDVIQPRVKRSIDALKLAQYLTLLLGLVALALALFYKALPRVQYGGVDLGRGLNFMTEAVALVFTIPLVAGIMGLRTEARSFLVSSLTTVTVFILSRFCLSNEFVMPLSVAINVLSFFGSHYFHNQGFAIIRRTAHRPESYVWQPTWEGIGKRFSNLLPTPSRLLRYSQDRVAKYGANPTLFALFMSFSYMIPFSMHSYTDLTMYNWLLAIRGMGALLSVGLLLKSQWPRWLLPYFPVYYHLSLLYCLPFVTTFLFLLEGGSIEWLLNVALSIMLLIVLADWTTFIGLSMLGIALALGLYRLGISCLAVSMDADTAYTLIYAVTFSTLIGLLFARRKQESFDQLTNQSQALLAKTLETEENLLEAVRERLRVIQTLKQAGIQDLLQVAKLISELRLKAKVQPDSEIAEVAQQLEAVLTPMVLQLRSIEDRATNFLRLSIDTLPIQELLATLQTPSTTQGNATGAQLQLHTHQQTLTGDRKRIQKLLLSSITALQRAYKETPILVGLEDTQLHYPLPTVRTGYIKKIGALRITVTTQATLPPLLKAYTAQMHGTAFTMPETIEELLLLENQRIVKAHYGYMHASTDTLLYVIPLQLREVRPKDIDKAYMELGATPIRANDRYKSDKIDAQAQEEEFLAAVAKRSTADLELVKSVIELIKWYHGPVNRKSGEPFYLHPIAVAQIVLDYNTDEAAILGALLHDTVEDTALLLRDIEAVFGKDTAGIVDTVTHLESPKDSFYKVKLSAEENILMLLAAGDLRALYVKLADRMHNMRTIHASPYASQLKKAQETLQFFVPLAQDRLKLPAAAEELKERSLAIMAKET
ncbi:MAG: HD domain-containing protein [Bacteroidota bacterium]